MGSHRLVGTHSCEEKQKREENRHKWLRITILLIHDHGEKRQEVGMDDYGGLEGTMGRKREETRSERGGMDMYEQEKEKKRNGRGKKKGKRASRNYTTH